MEYSGENGMGRQKLGEKFRKNEKKTRLLSYD
jgi:hypothetical protein